MAKYLRLAVMCVTRATCVISGRTVEFHNDSLEYCSFPSRVGGKKYQTICVERALNLLELKVFTMIEPHHAIAVVISLIAFLWIGVPLLESIPKVREHISRRFILTSVLVCLAVAACIDFSSLEENVRMVIIIGGLASGILMTVLYTLEKMSFTKVFGLKHVKVDLKDRVIETDFDPKETKELKAPDSDKSAESKPEVQEQVQDDLKGLAEREHNA